jgi:hypothetical protein
MTTVGSGQPPALPSITPLSLANSFTAGTFAPPPGDSGDPPPPPPPPPGSSALLLSFSPPWTPPINTDLPQHDISGRPTKHEGFIVGMLTATSGSSWFNGTYQSPSIQNFDAGNALASYSSESASFNTSSLVSLTQGGGAYQVTPVPQALQKVETGFNAYMEWGHWTAPSQMNWSGDPVKFDNKGYYVWGDKTTLLPSNITATYTGSAYGTMWSSSGGVDLAKGTVSMDVNFGSRSVSNFNLTVGGNYGISNGSGSIAVPCGSYAISGTSIINGSPGSTAYANGAFYGPDAKWTGGVWRATDGSSVYLNGNYVASRP